MSENRPAAESRAERAARRDRRQAPQGGFVDVVDELLEGGAQALPPPLPIPIVQTAESSLDLPRDWQTGGLPNLQPGVAFIGVANNLPPLPSSLGSVSGRRSTPSGHTPSGPGVPQPLGRRNPSSRPSQGSAGYVNAGSGDQRTGDMFEGPDQPTAHRLMGGLDNGPAPPIPARGLHVGTPARPTRSHPGRPAPISFHELGARAYSAYGEYEI